MRRPFTAIWIAVAAFAIAVPVTLRNASIVAADATTTVAFYSMDEPSGATTLVDSSPNHINGVIGTDVTAATAFGGATAHRFALVDPVALPVNIEHLDRVAHDARLNPDAADFAVTVRYRTTNSFGNVVQKGQNQTVGGYFKFEAPTGKMTCLFKGSLGQQRAVTSPQALNDGQWHTVRCERLSSGVSMYVDGVLAVTLAGPTGTISNDKTLSIGGKFSCNQTTITCDYFSGDIDYIRIEKRADGPPNVPPVAAFAPNCVGLVCTLSAAASSDPDGAIQTYAWAFGDGVTEPPTSQGLNTTHTFASPGTYNVQLTVVDDRGATALTEMPLTVAPVPELISFIGQSTSSVNSKVHMVAVPAGTLAGDGLVLFFSENTHSAMTEPAGWAPLGSLDGGYATTRAWRKVATLADIGASVRLDLVTQSKGSLTILVYRGTSVIDPVSSFASATDPATTATRVTPFATATIDQSWALSYWMHGDSLSSSLAPPLGVAVRAGATHTGGGRVTTLIADSNASIPLGLSGGLSATAPNASYTAATLTIVLAPQVTFVNIDPIATITSSCSGLHCEFSGTNSLDPDGTITSFTWDFGDGATATGATAVHDYADVGAYTITLTVVDDDLGSGVSTSAIVVSPPPIDVIAFVGSSMANVNAATISTTVPASVLLGDGLLMFLSQNSLATISEPIGISGWQQLASLEAGTTTTRVWRKVADTADAGGLARLDLSAVSKANLMIVAYRGTSLIDPVASFANTASIATTASRTTPITAATAPSWAVSYWMHRDSASTSLAAPVGVTARATGSQTSSGRVTCLVADSAQMVANGPYGGLTATGAATGGAATMWTIILAPVT